MSLAITVQAMLAAGCTAEQIAAVAGAHAAEDEKKRAAKRPINAARQKRFRQRLVDDVTQNNALQQSEDITQNNALQASTVTQNNALQREKDVTPVTRDIPLKKDPFPPTPPLLEKNHPPLASLAKRAQAREAFGRFWAAWPHKVQKPYAERCFAKVADEVDAIIDGVTRYIRDKPPDRAWLNPSTFLNQRRWEDQPGAAPKAGHHGKRSLVDAGDELIKRLDEQFAFLDDVRPADRGQDGAPTVRVLPGFRGQRP